ncbi:MAG: ABC transporter substrate-binding protein [Burkholderiales bacterium]|jgi:branched-chain amino acid transport system substrate-binding protein|nr:ABC transporter substrate-binding protein [Burkholderiales bacterium]
MTAARPTASRLLRRLIVAAAAACLALPAAHAQTPAKTTFKVGFVTFLSGPASGPFGVPAKLAAEAIVESLNAGKAPPPYQSVGFAGLPIELVIVDEAGGAAKQVSEYRTLVQRQNVDLVIGYIGSGDCLAVAPVADELKKLTVLMDCGTPRVFEDASYRYVFRTRAHATMDAVAAMLYLQEMKPAAKRFAGINQNYAFGQDSWADFENALKVMRPDAEIATSQMPKFGAGQYGAEISALAGAAPDVIHSSLWGADLEAFMLQAQPRDLFRKAQLVLVAGEPNLHRLVGQVPDGTIVGARGPMGLFSVDSPLNTWLKTLYKAKAGIVPNYPAYSVAQAFLGVKSAVEKARRDKIGNAIPMGAAKNVKEEMEKAYGMPTDDEIVAAFEKLAFDTPSGRVVMGLGKGHQAVQGTAYGTTKTESGVVKVVNIRTYPAEQVTPPEGVASLDWIRGGMKRPK